MSLPILFIWLGVIGAMVGMVGIAANIEAEEPGYAEACLVLIVISTAVILIAVGVQFNEIAL
jgi:hypothetical protein